LRRELASAHEAGSGFHTALFTLLLAREYLRAGRRTELPALAPYAIEASRAADVSDETAAALIGFAEALLAETVTLPLVVSTLQDLRSTEEGTIHGPAQDSRPN
jgi:hypothetical protein